MKSKLIISALAVATGLAIGGVTIPAANAQAKSYKTTPKSLRGSWHYHDKEFQYKLKITKNTLNEIVPELSNQVQHSQPILINWSSLVEIG